jgi:hypothetical protein
MNVPADDDTFDPDRILATLDAHRVDHVLVGGFAAGRTVPLGPPPISTACPTPTPGTTSASPPRSANSAPVCESVG